ncbi:hypothetical protein CROQUDRAFT_106576 [Cronartium quercuum f. sp. fusiforme G11]|uniref:Uncharacterized protein n=1 Tax=Cronartium quercuum f. sp. fusiforme G11 TaxID=708437 RepID=A0A9P6NN87_9BASI|nr:hypothetical protein CROQUDRAFT_106576 [Cronartium quercuum f. sp. fusiforme G11]
MPSELTPASIAALISNSLWQQADQFSAIISDLQTQLDEFKDLSSHKKKLDSNNTPDMSSKRNRMKPSPLQNAYTTPLPAGKPLRKLKTPHPSNQAPKELPINFYDPQWFAQLNAGQKQLIPNASQVTFLPDAWQSLLPTQHPDEKLSDSAFTAKYLESLSEPYRDALDNVDDGDDKDDNENDGDSTGSGINLPSANMNTSDESDFYSNGDFGSLYDSDEASEGAADEDDVLDEA